MPWAGDLFKRRPGAPISAVYKKQLRVRKLFDSIDRDHSNHIDIHEMAKLLNMLGKKVTKSELDEIFSTIDPDGSGEVDFDEFFAWFSSAGM